METLVIGAGQAGLAVSRGLTIRGVEHVVLERSRVAQSWRDRWDSLTLVTPNWTLSLPGSPYDGTDPQGHVPRDGIIRYLEQYRTRWQVPVREGVQVIRLSAGAAGRFALQTSDGPLEADNVVVCTGAFQTPHRRPEWNFPVGLPILTPHDYRNPGSVPEGRVLVIGNGETGCQIAEELHLAGREVHLSCGRAPWFPRRLGGLDTITWLQRAAFFEQRLEDITADARLIATPQFTGADGGRDLNFRTLQSLGVLQRGRLLGVDDGVAHFADDLAASVAFGDARWADVRRFLTDRLPALGFDVPEMSDPEPFIPPESRPELDLRDCAAVILAAGFRPDYRWIDFPVFDPTGFPITSAGAVPGSPGLYFCGVHFLTRRRSALIWGVGDDAEAVAEAIAHAPYRGAPGPDLERLP
ncbi:MULTISPECIES: NAD(P)-binding domain-containing protein [Arthrobacter]|uniref:NAD(P)-binding domain-containing protein n=2 Tax=Arthrobacter TaxID=1663 RepID=A0ABU9KNY6_9MICC|nr:NAD(P)-binding domain-containing protein [Arthrobacter sp. YJM1]MDP5227100.1 NAD(P)-binding domain-containing protein [Arthrobacter sp. YJM1]